jgi:predicted transcriptional regulator
MTATRTPVPGGELEEAVLSHLWQAGTATVRDIHEAVGSPRDLVYTTIARVLDRLTTKGLVAREMVGRTHVYKALADRALVERALIRERIGQMLGGDPLPAVAALVDAVEEIDATLLDELAREVELRRRERGHGA